MAQPDHDALKAESDKQDAALSKAHEQERLAYVQKLESDVREWKQRAEQCEHKLTTTNLKESTTDLQLGKCKTRISELEAKIREQNLGSNKLAEEKALQATEIKKLQKLVQTHEAQQAAHAAQLAQSSVAGQKSAQDVVARNAALAEEKARSSELNAQLKKCEAERDDLQRRLQQVQQQNAQVQREKAQVESNFTFMQTQSTKQDAELKKRVAELAHVTKQRDELQLMYSAETDKNKRSNATITTLTKEKERIVETVKQVQKLLDLKIGECKEAHRVMAESSQHLASQKDMLNLQKKLQEQQTSYQKAIASLASVQKVLESTQADSLKRQEAMQKVMDDAQADHKKAVAALEAHHRALQGELDERNKQASSLRSEIDQLREQLGRNSTAHTAANAVELAVAVGRVSDLEKQLQDRHIHFMKWSSSLQPAEIEALWESHADHPLRVHVQKLIDEAVLQAAESSEALLPEMLQIQGLGLLGVPGAQINVSVQDHVFEPLTRFYQAMDKRVILRMCALILSLVRQRLHVLEIPACVGTQAQAKSTEDTLTKALTTHDLPRRVCEAVAPHLLVKLRHTSKLWDDPAQFPAASHDYMLWVPDTAERLLQWHSQLRRSLERQKWQGRLRVYIHGMSDVCAPLDHVEFIYIARLDEYISTFLWYHLSMFRPDQDYVYGQDPLHALKLVVSQRMK